MSGFPPTKFTIPATRWKKASCPGVRDFCPFLGGQLLGSALPRVFRRFMIPSYALPMPMKMIGFAGLGLRCFKEVRLLERRRCGEGRGLDTRCNSPRCILRAH